MKTHDHLVDWLRDAHAMEKQAESILERQASRMDAFPEMQQRLRLHIDETRHQVERVESCLERLNGGSSSLKDLTGKMSGNMAAMGNAMASDEPVKNTIADFTFENFEIACYRSLIAAAEAAGDMQTAEACRENLREEEAMASWVQERLPEVTRSFLHTEDARA